MRCHTPLSRTRVGRGKGRRSQEKGPEGKKRGGVKGGMRQRGRHEVQSERWEESESSLGWRAGDVYCKPNPGVTDEWPGRSSSISARDPAVSRFHGQFSKRSATEIGANDVRASTLASVL